MIICKYKMAVLKISFTICELPFSGIKRKKPSPIAFSSEINDNYYCTPERMGPWSPFSIIPIIAGSLPISMPQKKRQILHK